MRTPSPRIQAAEVGDCAEIAKLNRLSRFSAMPWLPDLHTPEEDLAFFRDKVFQECTIKIARAERLVGFCAFRKDWLDHLYIDPDWTGRGIGTILLNAAKRQNVRVRLWVFRRNTRAVRFYESRGFRLIGSTEGDNEEREPDGLYEWLA